jgi:tetratricopeptide (TPR) repeat protein
MPVQARCSCGYQMALADEWAGKQGRCPECGHVLQIPAKKAGGPPPTRPAAPPAEPRPPALPEAQAMPEFASGQSPLTNLLHNPAWIAILVLGVGLAGVGVFLLTRDTPTDDPRAAAPGIGRSDEREAGSVPPTDAKNETARPSVPLKQRTPQDTASVQVKRPAAAKIEAEKPPADPAVATAGPTRPSDLHAWAMSDFGVVIPAGAVAIEIDGVTLGAKSVDELARAGRTVLVLPLGKHLIRFPGTNFSELVEPRRWFLDAYREAAAQVKEGDRWSFDRLLDASRRTMDRFTEPLVPHLWGNYYWQEGEFDAAARHFVWAAQIAPTFAPSYLNLAMVEHQRGNASAARRYLRLADLWNAQNAYGLALISNSLHAALGDSKTANDEEPDWLTASESALSARDRDVVAVLRSAAAFTPRPAERAKILNNVGAYFEHEQKPELALENYRLAAGVFAAEKPTAEEGRVIQGILENLARVCRNARMPEHRRYERLQAMVKQ